MQKMWPEEIVPVQSIAENGHVPSRYVKPEFDRPKASHIAQHERIPVIDVHGGSKESAMKELSDACRNWGVFQLVNHGIPNELLDAAHDVSRQFFQLPVQQKLLQANDPVTYVGYGSRVGVLQGNVLDWGDYFFHHFLPLSIREEKKWPNHPHEYRNTMREFCEEAAELCRNLLMMFGENLGLEKDRMLEEFGGSMEACVRLNYYPACPQPELTLGLSPHSDPGGITLLFQDQVQGLQIKRGDLWVPVPCLPHSLTVFLGDQVEIITNGMYKSVEHRAVVNSLKERMSIAFFCNPVGEKVVGPVPELVDDNEPAKYSHLSFNNYRKFLRTKGTNGKEYLQCSPRTSSFS